MNIDLQHEMLNALRRLTHPMADDRDRDNALRLIPKVEEALGGASAGWWGICCPNVHGEMEVLRDSETGEPALYVDRDNADEECEEINQSTDGGYYVCECDGDGNVVGAEVETPEEVTA